MTSNSYAEQRSSFINRFAPSLVPVLQLVFYIILFNQLTRFSLGLSVFTYLSATMLAPLFLTSALIFMGYTCYSLHTLLSKIRPLGIPYFIVPFYPSLLSRIFVLPFVRFLIKAFGLTHHWFFLTTFDWQVRQRYEIYRLIGSDIFFTVTPWKAILHVADPDMAVEVLAGKGKDGELYPKSKIISAIALFGENLVTVEGAVWRGHRKVTGPVIGKS